MLWTYTPVTFGLERSVPTVYHCVDLLGSQAGISQSVVEKGERALARAGAVAGASSEAVSRHLRDVGFRRIEEWPNVADLEVFAAGATSSPRRPRAVFAGNLTESKVDFRLLAELLGAGIEVHLAGPISEGGGDSHRAVRDLERAGAIHHGMVGPQELADLLRSSTVGLIPYVINEYTRGVNPLKTYEYLAAGLAVVSTPVPAVVPDSVDVFVAATAEQLVARVRDLLPVPDEAAVDRRGAHASSHGWRDRGVRMRALVDELTTTI
nr:glycosyltransferase [Aeromicrobium duanguangcaii]